MEPTEPRTDHGLRNGLLLATGLVVLALVVGLVAVVVVLHRVGGAVSSATLDPGPEDPGAPDRIAVAEGAAFTFHDQRFQGGWRLAAEGSVLRPQHLDFVSEDDSTTGATGLLDLRLYRHGVLLGVSRCRSTDTLGARVVQRDELHGRGLRWWCRRPHRGRRLQRQRPVAPNQ